MPPEPPAAVPPAEGSENEPGFPTGGGSSTDAEGMSVDQLSQAFAAMLRTEQVVETAEPGSDEEDGPAWDDDGELSARGVLEAMLFVGQPDNQPLASSEIAALLRGVQPLEIDRLVEELNETYAAEGAPYEIVGRGAGYQMVLRDTFQRVREKFYGRIRQARLSQATIDVLSIVAYNQPVTADHINKLRGAASGPLLSQLVRRRLLRIERPETTPRRPRYFTTDRFLQLFGLQRLEDLPRRDELGAAP